MLIQIYGEKDLKKSGGFKKKNNVLELDEQEFKDYVKTNSLNVSKGYIDATGYLSNNKRFRCYHSSGLILGVTSIVDEINEGVEQ